MTADELFWARLVLFAVEWMAFWMALGMLSVAVGNLLTVGKRIHFESTLTMIVLACALLAVVLLIELDYPSVNQSLP